MTNTTTTNQSNTTLLPADTYLKMNGGNTVNSQINNQNNNNPALINNINMYFQASGGRDIQNNPPTVFSNL